MKKLLNLFLKDCRRTRWALVCLHAILLAWSLLRFFSNGFSREYGTETYGSRPHVIDAAFYPLFGIISLLVLITVLGSEPLVSPVSYWRTRPMDAKSILRAKVLFVVTQFFLVPFAVFTVTYLWLELPLPLAVAAASLKAGALVSVAGVLAAMAYIAPAWGRYAGMLLSLMVVLFLSRALLGKVSVTPPIFSLVLAMGGALVAAAASVAVHRRRESRCLSGVVLFGLLGLLSGGALATATMGGDIAKQKRQPTPMEWMHETRVSVRRTQVSMAMRGKVPVLTPSQWRFELDVHDPSPDEGGFLELTYRNAMLDGRLYHDVSGTRSVSRYVALGNMVGKLFAHAGSDEWEVSVYDRDRVPESGVFTCDVEAEFHRWRLLGSIPIDGRSHTLDLGHTKFRLREKAMPRDDGLLGLDLDCYLHNLRPRDPVERDRPLPFYRGAEEFTYVYVHPDEEHCHTLWNNDFNPKALTPPDYSEVEQRIRLCFYPDKRESALGGTLYILKEETLGGIVLPLSAAFPMRDE